MDLWILIFMRYRWVHTSVYCCVRLLSCFESLIFQNLKTIPKQRGFWPFAHKYSQNSSRSLKTEINHPKLNYCLFFHVLKISKNSIEFSAEEEREISLIFFEITIDYKSKFNKRSKFWRRLHTQRYINQFSQSWDVLFTVLIFPRRLIQQ